MSEDEESTKAKAEPSTAAPQETPLELCMRTLSEAGRPVVDETAQKAGTVIQIIGYPRPPQNPQGAPAQPMEPQPVNDPNLEFNQKLEKLGILDPQKSEGLQIVFFQNKPQYPQKPQGQSIEPVQPTTTLPDNATET